MFKAEIRTIYGGAYNLWRSKMYDSNSTKVKGKEEWKYTTADRFLYYAWRGMTLLEVDSGKLKMNIINPKP